MKHTGLVVLMVVAFAFGIMTSLRQTPKTIASELKEIIEQCRQYDKSPSYIRCFTSQHTRKLIQKNGTHAVMTALGDLFASTDEIAGVATTSCHDFAHLVGEMSSENSSNIAQTIASCTQFCSAGCVHGALRVWLSTSDSIAQIPYICSGLPANTTEAIHAACEHGLGHGIADLNNFSLVPSLSACDKLQTDEAKINCGRGVIMELFDAPTKDHSQTSIPDNMLAWCKRMPGIYARSCFASAGVREYIRTRNEQLAIGICTSLDESLADECLGYLGSNMYFLLKRDVADVSQACRFVGGGMNACLRGVLESIAMYERHDDAKKLCSTLFGDEIGQCHRAYDQKVAYVFGQKSTDSTKESLPLKNALTMCSHADRRTSFISCVKKSLSANMMTVSAKQLMDALDVYDWKRAGKNQCHDVAHVIGQLGVKNNKPDVSFCSSSLCGDGCYHGALEGLMRTGVISQISLETLCSQVDSANKRTKTACFHGLGHGVASIVGSVETGLARCDEISGIDDRRDCGAGVFMELFQSSSFERDRTQLPNDIVGYCSGLSDPYKDVCLGNAGIYAYQSSKSATVAGQACLHTPRYIQDRCAMSLGGVSHNTQHTADEMIRFCLSVGVRGYDPCIRGVLQESVFSDTQSTVAHAICRQIPATEQTACLDFIKLKEKEAR